MNIAFFIYQFGERGSEIAVYDYAKYNEEILKNKSFIICFTDEKQREINFSLEKPSYEKFASRFPIFEINDVKEMKSLIQEHRFDFFHSLTWGGPNDFLEYNNKEIWGPCKTIKHCIFQTNFSEGDLYISIADCINTQYNTNFPVVPHMVDLPQCYDNLREELNIPANAIVLGRHGGLTEFNLVDTWEAIKKILEIDPTIYFLFMNTYPIYQHSRIIYLEKNVDMIFKVKFINTCDAMIHARYMGETFGLAIGEFSIKNKPVITWPHSRDVEHIKILGDKVILYHSEEELLSIFQNIRTIIKSRKDWNAYYYYTPENVMKIFNDILISTF
jgi:hypothetical protein